MAIGQTRPCPCPCPTLALALPLPVPSVRATEFLSPALALVFPFVLCVAEFVHNWGERERRGILSPPAQLTRGFEYAKPRAFHSVP